VLKVLVSIRVLGGINSLNCCYCCCIRGIIRVLSRIYRLYGCCIRRICGNLGVLGGIDSLNCGDIRRIRGDICGLSRIYSLACIAVIFVVFVAIFAVFVAILVVFMYLWKLHFHYSRQV
jgi:hypothetical protein